MRFAANATTIGARLFVLAILFTGVPTAFALGWHDDRLDDKRAILQLERQWRIAQIAGDLPTIDRMLAEDYVGINVTGQVNTKAQLLNRIRSHDLTLSRIDLREIKVKLLGDVSVVTVHAAVQGTSHGSPLFGNFRYTRIYHRVPSGAWKITNFEATRIPSRSVLPVVGRLAGEN